MASTWTPLTAQLEGEEGSGERIQWFEQKAGVCTFAYVSINVHQMFNSYI